MNEPSLTATTVPATMASAIAQPPSGGRVISFNRTHDDMMPYTLEALYILLYILLSGSKVSSLGLGMVKVHGAESSIFTSVEGTWQGITEISTVADFGNVGICDARVYRLRTPGILQ